MLKSVNFFGDYLGRWTRAGGRVTLVASRKQLEQAVAIGEKRIHDKINENEYKKINSKFER